MSHTKRWFNKDNKYTNFEKPWKTLNPFNSEKENNSIRKYIHRKFRHLNKIRLNKGLDPLSESKTSGWKKI